MVALRLLTGKLVKSRLVFDDFEFNMPLIYYTKSGNECKCHRKAQRKKIFRSR